MSSNNRFVTCFFQRVQPAEWCVQRTGKKLPNAGENDAAHPQSKDNSKKETAENIEAPQTGGKRRAEDRGNNRTGTVAGSEILEYC